MKKHATLVRATLAIAAFAAGCGELPDETVTTEQAAVCTNAQAVNVVLANIAASAALELRRWLPERDFVYDFSSGVLSLSSYGWARCPNHNCASTAAWLNLQNWSAHGRIIAGQALDVGVLRSRIFAQWDQQMTCVNSPDNHGPNDCPLEQHDLYYSHQTAGACDANFWFQAYRTGTTTPLLYPQQLRNMLIWAGYPNNPYFTFNGPGDLVTIDPSLNTVGGLPPPRPPIYGLTPNTSGVCTSVADGAVSPNNVVAHLGGQCQCMTFPTAQPVYTFKPGLQVGYLRCKP